MMVDESSGEISMSRREPNWRSDESADGARSLGVKKFVEKVQRQDTGRPSRYSVELANAICWQLTQGKSLLEICQREGMPHRDTVHNWLNTRPEFADMYARAREIQAHVLADEALAIADDTSRDRTEDGNPNWEAVQRARLRVDTRKWLASKLLPSAYADKQLHTGPDGQSPIQVEHSYRFDQLDPDELQTLRRLLRKARAPLIEG
jgi:hypothetical protein